MQLKANDYAYEEILKIIREWSEMTQKDFAKLVNRSYGAILKYENGQRNVTLAKFLDICKKCEVEIILRKK